MIVFLAEERTPVGNGDTMLDNFREGVYGFPECEFMVKLSKEEGRQILEKLETQKLSPGYLKLCEQLLSALITATEPSQMIFYYIQKPRKASENTIDGRQMLRYKYTNKSLPQRFMAIVFKVVIETAMQLDPQKTKGESEKCNTYAFDWYTSEGQVAKSISHVFSVLAGEGSEVDPDSILEGFIDKNNALLTEIVVNLFKTVILKGKNWSEIGTVCGMAVADLASLLMELAHYNVYKDYPLPDNISIFGLKSKKLLCESDFRYMDGDVDVVSSLDFEHFLKNDQTEVFRCMSQMRDKAKTGIPRPISASHPDWILSSSEGAVYVVGEAISSLDQKIPADFHVSVIATAHQLGYSKSGILLQTSKSVMRLYELIADDEAESQKKRIPCTFYESDYYDLEPRKHPKEEKEDNRNLKHLPSFVTTGGDFEHLDSDIQERWDNLNVRIRAFLHVIFNVSDRLCVLLEKKYRNRVAIDFSWHWLCKAGLISNGENSELKWKME